jgi:GDP-L-fucose synthase
VRLLITGAAGFIGRHLAESFGGAHEVAIPTRAELDLLDADAVGDFLKAHRFDVVLHAATERASRRLPAAAGLFERNCRMFFNLERHAAEFGRLLFFSSGAVYDRAHWVPRMPEDYFGAHVPAGDYGLSKYVCAKSIRPGGNVFELRLFGVFGPYEDWQVRFLSNACCRAVWDLPLVMRRNVAFDYLDVADLAPLVAWFFTGAPRHRHYNLCTGRTFDLRTLARKVVAASGKPLDIAVQAPGMGTEYSGDNSRLLEEMGPFPFRDMDLSIANLYRWYEARKDTIDPALLHFDAPGGAF